ncbi:type I methionyl aminopeptidase [candidate division WOR-3 bacterium]|nr:type I methionyl aminopeptidase [candidate division WOR-3 bacterium]
MISLKSKREIELMRKAGEIVGDLLEAIKDILKPGITTLKLDEFAEEFIKARNAMPAFKGYVSAFKKHYPSTLCTSVNESVVHEIPSNRVIKEGDIVSIDVGVCYKSYYGDAAYTFPVGKVDTKKAQLLKVTQESLYKGISQARPGNRLSDISHAIQHWVESHNFFIVRDFTGHGIGSSLHEEPMILNFGPPHRGPRLKEGMTLAIEPMVNMGTSRVKILSDGWRVVTCDGKPSAHFEHTITITNSEPEILTLPSKNRNHRGHREDKNTKFV